MLHGRPHWGAGGVYMRRKTIYLFVFISVLICMSSCSNPASSSEDSITYKVEVGVISNSTYTTAMNRISNWTELTYSNISSLRLYLYNNTISDHAIQTGITRNEIRDFMSQKGFSNYEVEQEMELLKQIGNDIAFFETIYGNDKKAWMYITK